MVNPTSGITSAPVLNTPGHSGNPAASGARPARLVPQSAAPQPTKPTITAAPPTASNPAANPPPVATIPVRLLPPPPVVVSATAPAPNATVPTRKPLLAIVPDGKIQVSPESGGPVQATLPFGATTLLDRANIEHAFTLKNVSDSPVTILRLMSSCGCLSAITEPGSPSNDPNARTMDPEPRTPTARITLQPGKEATIRVRVRLPGLPPGNLTKTVYVFTENQPDQPAAELIVTGTLQPLVTFAPGQLSFGPVDANKDATLPLAVTIDPRLAAHLPRNAKGEITPPSLVSSIPGIAITPATDAPATTLTAPPSPVTLRYSVKLTNDSLLGPLVGMVQFAPPPIAPTTGPNPTTDALLLTLAWRSNTLPVFAERIGDVRATPALVAFGLVRLPAPGSAATDRNAAKPALRQFVLTGTGPDSLTGVTVTSENPNLTVTVRSVGKEAPALAPGATPTNAVIPPAASYVLVELTVPRTAPAGPLSTRLLVTLANGQRLAIPVTAYIAYDPPATGKP